MRTALILMAGLFLLAALAIVGKLMSEHYPAATSLALYVFLALWLLATGFNLWIGVSKAGYSIGEELPIMLLLFALPAGAAILLKWKFL
jgi:hypothetical protein